MSDEPRDDSSPNDDAAAAPVPRADGGSAPWERPRRWNSDAPDSNRVDRLLARFGTDDSSEGRRSRREANDVGQEVPAGDLIASLSGDAGPADDRPAPKDPASVDETVVLPPRIGPHQPAPNRDPDDRDSRTVLIPKIAGSAEDRAESVAIRAALQKQGRADADPGRPAAALAASAGSGSGATRSSAGSGSRPGRGLLYAGRIIAAVVAVATLLGMGVGWRIKDRADTSLQAHAVPALDPADTHISIARTTPVVTTNSKGQTTTRSAAIVPAVYAPENILLLGSDTRAGGNAAIGGTDNSTEDVSNSDTLMVAHISGDRQHVTVLSIPRDTIVTTPQCRGWDANTGKFTEASATVHGGTYSHINSLYAVGGPTCTTKGVQSLTGLGITRMIGIDFAGFKAMVDALNGITVNVCRPVIDSVLGTVVAKGGTQVIGGAQAISLVRARHVQGDTESDLARIRRQQVVLSAILRQVTQAGTLLNPRKLDGFLQAFTQNTFTNNVKLDDLATLASSLGTLDPAHVTFYTLPTVPSTRIEGALDPDGAKAPAIFDDLVNDLPLPGEVKPTPTAKVKSTVTTPAPTSTASGLKLTVNPAKVALEIYNVAGAANVAGSAQQALNAVGFRVGDDDLYKPPGQTELGTTVHYAPENRAAALTVASAIRGSNLVVTPGLGTTVRLYLGVTYQGAVTKVKVGDTAPSSLRTPVSTGSSVATTRASSSAKATDSTALASVNAGAGTCA